MQETTKALHASIPPSSTASRVLNLLELVSLIASFLDGEDLFKALRINKTFQSILERGKTFWSKKLESHGFTYSTDFAVAARQLRHIYQHQLRTVENIKTSRNPLQRSFDLRDRTYDRLCRGSRNVTLVFRTDQDTGLTDIYNFGDLEHEGRPCFDPERIFASGRLCLGWESGIQLVRKIDDWSLVVNQLDTLLDSNPMTYDPAISWEILHSDWNELLCLHRSGPNAGMIQVWDTSGKNKIEEYFHPGLKHHLLLEETHQLMTSSAEGLGSGI